MRTLYLGIVDQIVQVRADIDTSKQKINGVYEKYQFIPRRKNIVNSQYSLEFETYEYPIVNYEPKQIRESRNYAISIKILHDIDGLILTYTASSDVSIDEITNAVFNAVQCSGLHRTYPKIK